MEKYSIYFCAAIFGALSFGFLSQSYKLMKERKKWESIAK